MGLLDSVSKTLFGDPYADAREAAEINYQRALAAQRQALGTLENNTTLSLQRISEGVAEASALFDRAESQVEIAFDDARRDTLDRETQALGEARSSLQRRGLTNTTVLDSAERGVRADTDRALGDLDQGRASALANLFGQEAGFEFQAASTEAGLRSNLATAQASQLNQISATQFANPALPDTAGLTGNALLSQLLGQGIGAVGTAVGGPILGGISDSLSGLFGRQPTNATA